MTTIYVYRGVTYTKNADQNITLKPTRQEKRYRGAKYLRLPQLKHIICDHIYRGTHYMA